MVQELVSYANLVEVDVELGNICSLAAWFTTFLVCRPASRLVVDGWVGVESENKAISAFN